MRLCFAAGTDLFVVPGVALVAPWVGTPPTEIFVGRGSNYVNDLIGKIRKRAGNKRKTPTRLMPCRCLVVHPLTNPKIKL